MKGKKGLPAGTQFLYGIASKDRLFRMHKSEKNGKATIRLLVYYSNEHKSLSQNKVIRKV